MTAEPVLVTGMGLVCSTGADVPSFRAALLAGRSGVVRLPGQQRPEYGAPLADLDFDAALAARAALPAALLARAAKIARRSTPPLRAAIVAGLEAWESAGLHRGGVTADRIAVVVAGSNLTGRLAQQVAAEFGDTPAYVPPRFALRLWDTDHVGALSHVLGTTGEGCTVGGASASGNLGIAAGARMVRAGAADACVVLGAVTDLSTVELHALVNVGAAAAGRPGAPFDEAHCGFVPGQGAACLVLESAGSVRARGAPVAARLLGHHQRMDGTNLAEPCEDGEVATMLAALHAAGRGPSDVGYVNAHGTGAPLGDQVEAAAVRRLFGADQPWLNSTKGLVGHCLGAAGVVEAVATVVQLAGGFVHGNAGLTRPAAPDCRLVGAAAEPVGIEVALSNSFGFGGFSSTIVLGRAA